VDSLVIAMSKITQHQICQLPVVEVSELVGIVSVGYLVKGLYIQVEARNRHLMDDLSRRF
jgi:hypothetical protein